MLEVHIIKRKMIFIILVRIWFFTRWGKKQLIKFIPEGEEYPYWYYDRLYISIPEKNPSNSYTFSNRGNKYHKYAIANISLCNEHRNI